MSDTTKIIPPPRQGPRWIDLILAAVAGGLDPGPHRGSDDRGAQRGAEPRTDRRADNSRTHADAQPYAPTDEDALGPAQLRNDRREFAHRVTRHGDVADAETLAPLDEELAQR